MNILRGITCPQLFMNNNQSPKQKQKVKNEWCEGKMDDTNTTWEDSITADSRLYSGVPPPLIIFTVINSLIFNV